MDLSALIFLALAVAWGAYLIPKALKHADDVDRTRSIEKFSASLRVLARREPVAEVAVPASRLPRTELRARRAAAARAAKRRLRVFTTLVVANPVVGGFAVFQVISWGYIAIPVALTLAWLVACRLMVKSERSAVVVTGSKPAGRVTDPPPRGVSDDDDDDDGGERDPLTEEIAIIDTSSDEATSAVSEARVDPARETEDPAPAKGSWDPVPSTLPTYVSKSPAPQRTVRTIDLESTGVWTSGHTDSASKLAREAEESERVEKAERQSAEERRVSGS